MFCFNPFRIQLVARALGSVPNILAQLDDALRVEDSGALDCKPDSEHCSNYKASCFLLVCSSNTIDLTTQWNRKEVPFVEYIVYT